jgi:magnesium chelatase family protein
MVEGYQKRISGPMVDRIDIHVEAPPVDYEKLSGQATAEPSAAAGGVSAGLRSS